MTSETPCSPASIDQAVPRAPVELVVDAVKSESDGDGTPQGSTVCSSLQDSEKAPQIASAQVEPPAGGATLPQWNRPRINVYRYLAALYSFVIMGMSDACYGVSFVYLASQMDHTDAKV